MTEAIIITAIIVGGLVALAGIALHFGFKAWKLEREREAAVATASAGRSTVHIHTDATPQEAERAARDYVLVNPN